MLDKKVYFYLPVHNEEMILSQNVEKLLNFCVVQEYDFDWRIVIVVNGSSDETLNIAHDLQKKYSDKIEIDNYPEPGRGLALKRSFLKSKADIVLYMDIDLAVSLKNITELITPFLNNKSDLIIGSRLLANSQIKRSFVRELSSQGYNILSRLLLRHHFSDMQCGFKAIKAEVFKKIAPNLIDDKWFFDTELIVWTKKMNYDVREVAVDWSENRYDKRKSKVKLLRDSFLFLVNLLKLRRRLAK